MSGVELPDQLMRVKWLQSLLTKVRFKHVMNVLYSDSQSAIHFAKNSAFHSRTRHITILYHFIRPLLEDGMLTLVKIHNNKNPTYMLTKALIAENLELCVASMGQG